MDLLLVRHGVAEDRARARHVGIRDTLRPLTEDGRAKVERAARGLRRVVDRPSVIMTSPLLRATETAHVLGKAFGCDTKETRALLPEADPGRFFAVLAEQGGPLIAAVGHEPHLTSFIGSSLGVHRQAAFVLKKGGACLLRFDSAPGPGSGVLLWLATSGMLGRMRP